MKHLFLSLLLALVCSIPLCAQRSNEANIKKEISAAAARIKTMQCHFVQTKYVKLLNDKMVSKGQMYFRASDRLRWVYTSPYSYVFVLNGQKVLLKKGNRSDVINTAGNKMFREIARIMMSSVVGNCLTDDKNFKSTVSATSTEYLATLYPQRKELKGMFQKIILHADRKKGVVTSVELTEKNGDRTVITLQNIQTNVTLNDALFKVS